mmetsp:Transcript_50438/g.163212  ORF Transcript_50438/g.163212 Transcript_50438/m.163212 type:complete len:252 (+) Transcript_50438:1082-1837(+)
MWTIGREKGSLRPPLPAAAAAAPRQASAWMCSSPETRSSPAAAARSLRAATWTLNIALPPCWQKSLFRMRSFFQATSIRPIFWKAGSRSPWTLGGRWNHLANSWPSVVPIMWLHIAARIATRFRPCHVHWPASGCSTPTSTGACGATPRSSWRCWTRRPRPTAPQPSPTRPHPLPPSWTPRAALKALAPPAPAPKAPTLPAPGAAACRRGGCRCFSTPPGPPPASARRPEPRRRRCRRPCRLDRAARRRAN